MEPPNSCTKDTPRKSSVEHRTTRGHLVPGNGPCAWNGTGAAYRWGHTSEGPLDDGTMTSYSNIRVAVETIGFLASKTLTHFTVGGDVMAKPKDVDDV
jgi:hypothetical protein